MKGRITLLNGQTDVIIVGGGPAGLSTAHWLQKMGVNFRLLEKDRVGSSWHNHYDSLSLHTLKELSGLPGFPMPDEYPSFVPRQQVATYLSSYADHFDFPRLENTTVEHACFDSQSEKWQIHTSAGPMSCRILIVATGIWATPNRPNFAGEASFPGSIIHAQSYKNPSSFADQRVLVVGAGNSGTEIAVEISAVAAATTIAIRGGSSFVPYPNSVTAMRLAAWLFQRLPDSMGHRLLKASRPDFSDLGIFPPTGYLTDAYPVVGFELPEAVRAGTVKVVPAGIDRIEGETVVFSGGQTGRFDALVLATGYRPTVNFLAEDTIALDQNGWPRLEAGGRSSEQPNLFCIGFTYPNTEGWLQSIPRFSHQTAKAVQRSLALVR